MKIRQAVLQFLQRDRQTDVLKLIGAFLQLRCDDAYETRLFS
jgi:hypothetical protein